MCKGIRRPDLQDPQQGAFTRVKTLGCLLISFHRVSVALRCCAFLTWWRTTPTGGGGRRRVSMPRQGAHPSASI